jgi:CelD/BcsL family acetyltransferase involved in cellulose biosynthesis
VTLELVRDIERLEEIQPKWTELVEHDPASTPFQLPSWLLTWWQHFGSGSLHVPVFWRESRLAGLVPCFQHVWENRQQLTLIGSGISDYLDPIIEPAYSADVLEVLQEHLDQSQDWELCVWQDLSTATPLQKLRGAYIHPDIQCAEAPLTGDFEQFWESRSKDLRRNVKRYSQRAREMGAVEFEATDEAPPELLNALIRLHTARWREQGESGMIAANRSEGFLRAIAAEMAVEDRLRLFALRFRDEVVAAIMAFRYGNKIYAYMSAFDPDYESLGFGRTLLYEALRHVYAEAYDAWNFLRGGEAYKSSWGAEPIARCRVVIENERAKSRA